ncbi:glycosyltransferase family A protein [Sutcliffiella horikoshii]|uniref:glycosyltransferase family A protein n=1 Tax=Sutcliffiella horikoshii TaxID=79883 RepID=UPI003CE6BEFE
MNEIVILTPSYNRAKTLTKLYESLIKQGDNNFEWLIVDDGSTDETRVLVKKMKMEGKIKIKYIVQQNGGKARALNRGFSYCDYASVFVVVDSDDYLLPSAIKTIQDYLERYRDNKEVGAFFFHYQTPSGSILKPDGKVIDSDKMLTRYQYNNIYKKNDGCICYLNKAVKKYRYPEFSGENYVGPTVIQLEMANEYKIIFSPKIVGVAEYLDGGLSKSGRLLRVKNPMGMLYYVKLMLSSKSNIFTQMKYALSIWPYAKYANKSFLDIVKMVRRPILLCSTYIPGQILYLYWNKKFKKSLNTD